MPSRKMSMPSLMLLDGESRTTLGIVRSLGRMGIPLAVGSSQRYARACYSRYTTHRFTHPPIRTDLMGAHRAIMEQVRTWKPDVLMPVRGVGWSCVYAFYDEYAALTAVVPNPGREYAERLEDKDFLAQKAEECGVPAPRTFRPASHDEAFALRHRLPYPVLLKPRSGGLGSGIRRVENADEFKACLHSLPDAPVIQEYIDGDDIELTILAFHGEALAGHVYACLRNYPVPYGPPIACRSIRDEALMQTGIQFLKKLGYHGVAHMDLRRDKRDGCAKLLDFQAPLPGSNELSIHCGANFALLLYKLALGEKPEPCFPKNEVECRWLVGELRHLAQTPNKGQTLRELLKWRDVATDFSLLDPIPHVVNVVFRLSER